MTGHLIALAWSVGVTAAAGLPALLVCLFGQRPDDFETRED